MKNAVYNLVKLILQNNNSIALYKRGNAYDELHMGRNDNNITYSIGIYRKHVEQTAAAAVSGAGDAVTLCISLLGIMCLWTGISKIGEEGGLIKIIAKALQIQY